MTIPIYPTVDDLGIRYIDAEDEILTILRGMKCYPTECYPVDFEALLRTRDYNCRSFYSFQRTEHDSNQRLAESATIKLFIPDDQPAALLAKLRWG